MGSLIDTSIFIESERGRLDLDSHISARGDEDMFMSVITASELLHGVHRAGPDRKLSRSTTIEGWIEQFPLLDIDLAVARSHARLFAVLKAAGQVIGPHDLWLAASCLTHGLKMVTGNIREFERIPGLIVEDWSREA
jgi:tRNA(fMet)-specific endonuclease VapC